MRIYKYRKEIADRYFEVAYEEYREDGTLKQTGTEDFSVARYHDQTEQRWIYTWDGQKRNAGNHRWFECREVIRISKGDLKTLKKVMADRYPEAEIIQCR